MGDCGDAKVTQYNLSLCIEQHILWLDVSMYYFLVVCILERISHLPNIEENRLQRELFSSGVAIAQGATRGVIHDQIGEAVLDAKLQDAHNMWMTEPGRGLRLCQKVFLALFC